MFEIFGIKRRHFRTIDFTVEMLTVIRVNISCQDFTILANFIPNVETKFQSRIVNIDPGNKECKQYWCNNVLFQINICAQNRIV